VQTCDSSSNNHGNNNNERETQSTIVANKTSCDENYDNLVPYLGGEAPLLDIKEETTFVLQLLKSLTFDERDYMINILKDPSMPIRHLRAEKGHFENALNKLQAALHWRREFGVDRIIHRSPAANADQDDLHAILCRENESGKIYVRGYDRQGRALMYMRPGRENTHDAYNNMRHLVWNLEKAIACTRRKSTELGALQPLEKINLVIDYQGFRLQDSPPMSTSRWTLDILQKHYPECMYRAFVVNPPFVFKTFWALIRPFIDATTKQKIIFCTGHNGTDKFTEHIQDVHKLEQIVGGTADVPDFDSHQYMHLPFDVSYDE